MIRSEGMYLILGTTPETNWPTASVLLENAGWVVSAEHSEACYQSCEAHTTEGGRFLLLHSHPEEAIAHTIANGVPPEQAREVWLNAAKAMVNFYKRNRKHSVMVYIPNLMADPKAQLTTVAAHLGLPDDALPTTTTQVEQAPLLERLIASQLLQQTPDITALLAQIEACTVPLTGHSYSVPGLNLDSANRQLVTLRANLAESEQLAMRLQQELSQHLVAKRMAETAHKAELNDTLAKQLRTDDTNSKLEEELAGQQQRHAAELVLQMEQQEELRSQLAELTFQSQQSSLLLKQLRLVQEELEAKFISHNQLQEQLVKIEAQWQTDQQAKQNAEKTLKQTEKKHREVETEYKEDLNLKLVTLRSAEKARRKLEEELASQKLHHATELARKNEQQAELRSQLTGLTLQSQQSREQLVQIEVQRQTDLGSFKSGIAFKATAPVRALNTKLRGNLAKKALKKQLELVRQSELFHEGWELIRQSGLFHEDWYLKTYPDVAENGIDPILHYLKFSTVERRNPSPEFDTDWYLTSHPDVAEAGMNPLIHYIEFGQQEGRSTSRHNNSSLPTLSTA